MNRRTALVIALTVMATLTLAGSARAWTVAAQNHRRVQEGEVRHSQLYQQLANREAVLESQRPRPPSDDRNTVKETQS
jgi:hypothetical protein